jgi:hypothetical protein
MPPTTRGDPVDDVRGKQFDPAAGQRGRQPAGEFAVFVVAHPAARRLLVDHHCDRRIRPGRGGHVGDVSQRIHEIVRKVNAHNTSHLAAIDGDEHEGFLRHEAEHCGQGRDQNAGPVQVKVGWLRCRHDANLAIGTAGFGRQMRHLRAPGDEFALGDNERRRFGNYSRVIDARRRAKLAQPA